jgi:3D (Asp-Asp-Asp) domain-containing protein
MISRKTIPFIFISLIFLSYITNITISPTSATDEPLYFPEEILIKDNYYEVLKSQNNNKEIFVCVTGYSSSYDETDENPWITASGEFVKDGIVAANFLSFGTKIKIPSIFGDKVFIVKDRMHHRYNNKNFIDIWFPTKEEAFNFGKICGVKIEIVK